MEVPPRGYNQTAYAPILHRLPQLRRRGANTEIAKKAGFIKGQRQRRGLEGNSEVARADRIFLSCREAFPALGVRGKGEEKRKRRCSAFPEPSPGDFWFLCIAAKELAPQGEKECSAPGRVSFVAPQKTRKGRLETHGF